MSTPAAVRAAVEAAFRDHSISGVPASGDHEPVKSEIRNALGVVLESALASVGSGIARYATVPLMEAVTDSADGSLAYVYANNDDPADAANGVYQWMDADEEWVTADWYFAAMAAVVQPLVDEAEAARDAAGKWASEDEDTEVAPGEFSARHYALKAAAESVAAAAAAAALSDALEDVASLDLTVSGIDPLFETVTSANLFKPATGVAGVVVNPAGVPSASARYGLIVLSGEPGQQFCVSIKGRDGGFWNLNQANRVMFYSSATLGSATLVSNSAPGVNDVAFADAGDTVCGTFPSGSNHAVILPYAIGLLTPTSDDFGALFEGVMANTGLTALPWAEYVEPNTRVFGADAANPKPVEVIREGTEIYVRQPHWQLPDEYTIRRLAPDANAGVVDFLGQALIPRTAQRNLSKLGWRYSTAIWQSADNAAPVRIDRAYQLGRHGTGPCYRITAESAHGLTAANEGDVHPDVRDWVVVKVENPTQFLMHVRATGGSTNPWDIDRNATLPSSGTLNLVNAGAIPYTLAAPLEHLPMVQDLGQTLLVDGEVVDPGATHAAGQWVEYEETYGGPNVAKWVEAKIANHGSPVHVPLNDPNNATHIIIQHVSRFDRFGARTGWYRFYAVEDFSMTDSGSIGCIGGFQQQVLALLGQKVFQHVPGVAAPISGYNLDGADITTGFPGVTVRTQDLAEPTNPSGLFSQYNTTTGGVPTYALDGGYLTDTLNLAANDWQVSISNARKTYGVMWDCAAFPTLGGSGRLVTAGTGRSGGFFQQLRRMDDLRKRIDALFETPEGRVRRAVSIVGGDALHEIVVPREFNGQKVTVIAKSAGLSIKDSRVVAGRVLAGLTGGKGWCVLELGG